MKKLLFSLGILVVLFINIAATGTSQANAVAIISVIGLGLPFLYKLVPAVGKYMVAITVVVSLATAVLAEVLSGELSLSNLQSTDPSHLYFSVLSVYGLSQFIFSTLKQSPKTANAVV